MQAGLLYLFYDIPRALNRLLIVSLASILQAFSLLLLDGAHQRLRRTSRAWYLVFITLNSKAVDCNHGAPHTLREYCKNRQVTYLPTTKNFRGIGFVIQRVSLQGEQYVITSDRIPHQLPCGDLCAITCLAQAETQPVYEVSTCFQLPYVSTAWC